MAVTRNSSRRGSRSATPAPVVAEPIINETEETTVSTDTLTPETLTVDAGTGEAATFETEVAAKPKRKYNRPTEAIEARKRLTEYKHAMSAVDLLKSKGFEVTFPEGWEHPDKANERERARKALEAYKATGGDLSELLGEPAE